MTFVSFLFNYGSLSIGFNKIKFFVVGNGGFRLSDIKICADYIDIFCKTVYNICKVRLKNSVKSWAVMPSPFFFKEVIAMDENYIISFMLILLLLALTIKK